MTYSLTLGFNPRSISPKVQNSSIKTSKSVVDSKYTF